MRKAIPLVLIAALAGCTMAPPQPAATTNLRAETRLAALLSGKVAGTPQSCLPSWRTNDMTAIDDNTIVFEAPGHVWVQKPQSPCNLLGSGTYALVTRTTTPALCRGEIAEVLDTVSGASVGSCVMGDFIPYTRPVG